MNINFSNFKKNKIISTELDLSIPGISLKQSPKTTITDSENNTEEVIDVELGEEKDNRVNFLYASDTSFVKNGVIETRYKGDEVSDLEDDNGNELIEYPENGSPATLNINGTNVPIKPAHVFMTEDVEPETSRDIFTDRLWFSACGFWDNQNYNLRKFISVENNRPVLVNNNIVPVRDSKASPFLKYKTFKRRLKAIREDLLPRGIDILVTIYERSLDVDGNDVNESGIDRKTNRAYNTVKPLAQSFILNKNITPTPADEITPFDVSIHEIQKSLGFDSDDLFDDLISAINSVRDNFNSVSGSIPVNSGSVVSSTLNTINLGSSASNNNDEYNGMAIKIEFSNYTEENIIVDYDGINKIATVQSNWISLPNNLYSYNIYNSATPPVDNSIPLENLPDIIEETRKLNNKYSNSLLEAAYFVNPLLAVSVDAITSSSQDLESIIKKIEWFEFFNGISLKNSRTSVLYGDVVSQTQTYRKQARLLFPVDLGIKTTRRRIKGGGFFRAFKKWKYTRTDLGVRFVEIKFVNTSILSKFRANNKQLGSIQLTDPSGAPIYQDNPDNPGQQQEVLTLELTKPDPVKLPVDINFTMPSLPFDEELRKIAFDKYGFVDQSKNAGNRNIYNSDGEVIVNFEDGIYKTEEGTYSSIKYGYEVYKDSSNKISSMRGGLDIYKKAQFLVSILKDAFGNDRVKVTETLRSFEDQEKLQMGGSMSNFLSWHNYGLAMKIIITQENKVDLITDGSDDFFKLLSIAEAFTKLCYNGDFGEPINVVWCGRLQTGPDNFVWEFLPIGVNHKDCWKLRESLFNQIEPIESTKYVDVVSNGYIVNKNNIGSSPYILNTSDKLANSSIKIGNRIYVSPNDLINYKIPNNLILKDIQEYLFLISNKFSANGNKLTDNLDVFNWKINNPISYSQLIQFHSLLGNYNLVRNFLSLDYVETYNALIASAYATTPDVFIRSFIGTESFNSMKINLKLDADFGYINISDGKLYIKITDVISNYGEGNGNTFGQAQLDPESITEIDNGYIISDSPVLTDTQLKVIYNIIRDELVAEFNSIKESYRNIQTEFLYDSILDGSNSDSFDTLENEFGVIKTQDLIDFDQLRGLFNRVNINSIGDQNPDGTTRGAGINLENDDTKESVYEKLISVAQNQGVQLVNGGTESLNLDEIDEESVEDKVKRVSNNNDFRVENF